MFTIGKQFKDQFVVVHDTDTEHKDTEEIQLTLNYRECGYGLEGGISFYNIKDIGSLFKNSCEKINCGLNVLAYQMMLLR